MANIKRWATGPTQHGDLFAYHNASCPERSAVLIAEMGASVNVRREERRESCFMRRVQLSNWEGGWDVDFDVISCVSSENWRGSQKEHVLGVE